jgi:hypothetical protein
MLGARIMPQETIQQNLLITLAGCYEQDPSKFLTLPKETMDSSSARVAVAELRNDGFVEEQVRGVIRMTPYGYCTFKKGQRIPA